MATLPTLFIEAAGRNTYTIRILRYSNCWPVASAKTAAESGAPVDGSGIAGKILRTKRGEFSFNLGISTPGIVYAGRTRTSFFSRGHARGSKLDETLHNWHVNQIRAGLNGKV